MKTGYFGIDPRLAGRPSACAALSGDLRLDYLDKLGLS